MGVSHNESATLIARPIQRLPNSSARIRSRLSWNWSLDSKCLQTATKALWKQIWNTYNIEKTNVRMSTFIIRLQSIWWQFANSPERALPRRLALTIASLSASAAARTATSFPSFSKFALSEYYNLNFPPKLPNLGVLVLHCIKADVCKYLGNIVPICF